MAEVVVAASVATVVDIRHNPVSPYRPELSKRNFAELLRSRGIGYVHRRDLGVPRAIRAHAQDVGSLEPIWEWYDQAVVPGFAGRNLHDFFNSATHPVALMCVEASPTDCHRHRLSLALERAGLTSRDL